MICDEIFLRKAIETAEGFVIAVDSNGNIKLFNHRAQEVTGYQAEEVLGKPWVEIFVPDEYKPVVRGILDSALRENILPRLRQYPIRAKDGKAIFVCWDRSLIRNEHGDVEGIFSIGRVLTPPKIIEEDDYHTRMILESMADGVVIMDRDFRISYFNQAAGEITGFKKEEVVGRYYREIFSTCHFTDRCLLRESMETGKSFVNLESYILNRHDEKILVTVSSAAYRDMSGNVIGGIQAFRRLPAVTESPEDPQSECSFHGIVSKSKAFQEIFSLLPRIAESDSTVLITGESGTGKELIATAIHDLSHRRTRPLIEINCSVIPEGLLESELFGYKRGAFTDAKQDKPGRFKMAEGGTIFLDEIGNSSLAAQAKLLRVLETRNYEPLGAKFTEKADVRIISASNKNLLSLVEAGKFMKDLYYRINVVPINIPPLRQRPEDIPLLIDHFLRYFNRIKGKNIAGFTRSALNILLNYDYPGNVRELKSIVEYAFILSKASHIGPECLPSLSRGDTSTNAPVNRREVVLGFEREMILHSLKEHNGSVKAAAKAMGIHRVTLWKKMKRGTTLKHATIMLEQLIISILPLICLPEVVFC